MNVMIPCQHWSHYSSSFNLQGVEVFAHQFTYPVYWLSLIGNSKSSNQGDKSGWHSKLKRYVALQKALYGEFAAKKYPRQNNDILCLFCLLHRLWIPGINQ